MKIYEFGLVSNGVLLASTMNEKSAYRKSEPATNYVDLKGALMQAILMYSEAISKQFISHFSMEHFLILLEKFLYNDQQLIFFLVCEKKKRGFKDLLRDQNIVVLEQMKPKFAQLFESFEKIYKLDKISNDLSKYEKFLDDVALILNFESYEHKAKKLF